MKVLIADDERMVRLSLKSMLMDINLPIDIVGEAKNGEEMVELLRETSPDIAFVDIKMPKLGGLEAIKEGKTISPNTKWVILTGFSQFDYAKEAIRLGASSYLLKPVSPSELEEVLSTIISESNVHQQILNQKFERDIISLYHDPGFIPQYDTNNIILKSKMMIAIFYIDSSLDENEKAVKQRKFSHELRSVINNLIDSDLRIALFNLPDGNLATVCVWGFNNNENIKSTVYKYFFKISQLISEYREPNFSISMLQTDEFVTYKAFYQQLEKIQSLSPLRVTMGIGSKLTIRDLTLNGEDFSNIELSRLAVDLCDSYNQKAYLNYIKIFEKFKKAFSNSKIVSSSHVRNKISVFLNCSIGCSLSADTDNSIWMNTLAEYGEALLSQSNTQKSMQYDLVSQVISYIDENYMHDIGIATLAEKLAVTPNYLSSLFHKKKGMKFIDYLTEVRILNAKKLLKANPDLQVKQVASEVGYYSTRHFTKQFVKVVGCYPSEYQRNQPI